MKKIDYTTYSNEMLMTVLQFKLAYVRKNDPMEDVTIIRNILKDRRIRATIELKNLLNAENLAQRFVTNYIKLKGE